MSGSLAHGPAEVIRKLLVDLSLGTLPSSSGAWPINVGMMPDSPDKVLLVNQTTGILEGRVHTSGESQEHYGIIVTVRAVTYQQGWTKANAIATAFDEDVLRDSVTISSTSYVVQSVSRRGSVLHLGNEQGTKRQLFTINAITDIRQSS